jgi:hypothetical protein
MLRKRSAQRATSGGEKLNSRLAGVRGAAESALMNGEHGRTRSHRHAAPMAARRVKCGGGKGEAHVAMLATLRTGRKCMNTLAANHARGPVLHDLRMRQSTLWCEAIFIYWLRF